MAVASQQELGLFIRAVDDYGAEVPVLKHESLKERGRHIVRVRLEDR